MLDLSNICENHPPLFSLAGEWQFFPGVFLDPKSPIPPDSYSLMLTLPGRLKTEEQTQLFGTLRLQLLLPEWLTGRELVYSVNNHHTANKVFVNGELFFQRGIPATTPDEQQAQSYVKETVLFKADSQELEILIHQSDFTFNRLLVRGEPKIGEESLILTSLTQDILRQNLILGGMLIMLAYHLLILLIRKDPAIAWFCAILSVISFRILIDEGVIHGWFPNNYIAVVNATYISFYLLVPLILIFLRKLYPAEFPRLLTRLAFVLAIVWSLLSVSLPADINAEYTLPAFQRIAMLFMLSGVVGLGLAAYRKREDIGLMMAGMFFFVISATNDLLYYAEIVDTFPASHFGWAMLIFFQAAIMASRYNRVFLNYQRLNQELEEQVANRTRELNQALSRLYNISVTDPLTGLYNRRHIYESVAIEVNNSLSRWHYTHRHKAVLMLDIDHFKKINDRYGHESGDLILKRFTEVLKSSIRSDDTLVRWGGEEFLVILKEVEPARLGEVCGKLLSNIKASDFATANERELVRVSSSLGVVLLPFSQAKPLAIELLQAIKLADIALYKAKKSGRDCGFKVVSGDGFQGEKASDWTKLPVETLEQEKILCFEPI